MNRDDLNVVNAKVNLFPYEFHVEELWQHLQADMPRGACSNYATTKYTELVARGWPKSALRLACCYVETGEYHAVLLVDVDGQTWVLDNRHPYPMEYEQLPYTWDKLQIAGTDDWESAHG